MGNYKNENGKTRVSVWLGKVKEAFPDIAGEVVDVMAGESPLKSIVDLLGGKKNDEKSAATAEALLFQYDFERDQMEYESKMFGLEVDDRKRASEQYSKNTEMADFIANRVINWNLWVVIIAIIIEICSVIYIDDKVLVAIVSGAVGSFTTALLQERQQIINFFFGSSKGSKDKDKTK